MNGSDIIQRDTQSQNDFGIQPMAPRTVYAMEFTSNPGSNCVEFQGLCQENFVFNWLREDSMCQASFTCGKLDGNVCGEFGVNFKVGEGTNGTDVCYIHEVVRQNITAYDNVEVSLWHVQDASVSVKCYLWCSDTGKVPTLISGPKANPDLVQNLVSAFPMD